MATHHGMSWAAVEEKLQMDMAIWKSGAALESSRHDPKEFLFIELVEGASIKLVDRGMAVVSIGKLEWEVTPPSAYMGNNHDDDDDYSLMMTDHTGYSSGFRVALRSPQGRRNVLHLWPTIEDWSRSDSRIVPGFDDKLHYMLTQFFTSEGTAAAPVTPRLRRTMSMKKRADIVGKNFGPPFLRCVFGLQTATGISDVLDVVLGFSAAYLSNQQILDQLPEEEDEDCYFYDEEDVEEELRLFNVEKRRASFWVRQQVRDAAMKCLASVEATSEVVDLGVGMLLKMKQEAPLYDIPLFRGYASDMLRMSHILQEEGNGIDSSTSRIINPGTQIVTVDDPSKPLNYPNSGPGGEASSANLENFVTESESGQALDDSGSSNPPPRVTFLRTRSFVTRWQSEIGNDTVSESTSWDLGVQTEDDAEAEDDVLGSGITDAKSLDVMLRDRDPCGSSGCSNLITEFLNLKRSSSVSSPYKGKKVGALDTSKCSVLKRLASWSSTNSAWPDRDIPLTPKTPKSPAVGRRMGTGQLESLAEEEEHIVTETDTETDPETARLCQAFTERAVAKGDVLQWCSCKFNKARSSIELRFQVGSFMEDDIATFSTGIVLGSSLRIEIFLDVANMRQSLLDGNVRISVDQLGLPTEETPPVIGLSCYIPHLVRNYLKYRHTQAEQSNELNPDGELLTGLMKHVVAKLVFMKRNCCVCHGQPDPAAADHPVDPITAFLPRPCDQNLCQALHEAWLVVAPRVVVEESTVEHFLRNSFQRGNYFDEARMLQFMDPPLDEWVQKSDYLYKLSLVVKWLRKRTVRGSWLTVVDDADTSTTKEELDYSTRQLSIDQRENYRPEAALDQTLGGVPSSTHL